MPSDTSKIASTVRGPKPVSDLGITLAHEHIAIDTTPHQRVGNSRSLPRLLLDYTSGDAVTEALHRFKLSGGTSIMEATPAGCGRNPLKLRELSDKLDLHIICATGWYREENHPSDILTLGVSGRTDILIRELALGIDDTGIRPGFLKVAASQEPTPEEEVTVRAAARAQREAGVGLALHITKGHSEGMGSPREVRAVHRLLDVLEHEGADLEKVCLCHADGTYFNPTAELKAHFSLLKRGVYLGYDQFAFTPIPEPGFGGAPAEDALRVRAILALLEKDSSYLSQLLLSQDVASYEQLRVAHGAAYSHLLDTVRPQLLAAGLTDNQADTLFVRNPAAFLSTPALPTYTYRPPVQEFGKSAWYWHRAVRSKGESGGLLYPPEHVPVLQDEAMRGLTVEEVHLVLAVHLATLLRFTIWLELNPVLQVARDIFEGRFPGLALPEPTRQIALLIMSDEVSHTDLAFEYLRDLQRSVSLPDLGVEGVWQQRIEKFISDTPDKLKEIALLAYVLASETSITAALDIAPKDSRVQRRIRELLRDHADDERRHHDYFSGILRSLWVATRPSEQTDLGELLVRALETFLFPPRAILLTAVSCVKTTRHSEIVERVLDSAELREEMRAAAMPMLNVLRDVGAFREDGVVRAFMESPFEFNEELLRQGNHDE